MPLLHLFQSTGSASLRIERFSVTRSRKNYFHSKPRCASRSRFVSETSFTETCRVIFMDFLKFSMTIRRPSSGMLPSELNPSTEES